MVPFGSGNWHGPIKGDLKALVTVLAAELTLVNQGLSCPGSGKGRGEVMAQDGIRRGEVVALMDTGRAAVPPQFAQLEAYWLALHPPGGGLPCRADFDPRGIADLLDCTLMLERIAPGQVRIRLAGMALCDLLGMELRGMPLTALMVPASRDPLALTIAPVFEQPCIAEFDLTGETGMLRPPLAARLLVLPMTGRLGKVDLALACLVSNARRDRPPRRLTLTGSKTRPVQALTPAQRPAFPEPRLGLAEAPARFIPAPPRGKPRLRLIKG